MAPEGCQAVGENMFYLPFSATDWTGSLGLGSLLAALIKEFIILSLVTHFLPLLVWTFNAKKFPSGLHVNLGSMAKGYSCSSRGTSLTKSNSISN